MLFRVFTFLEINELIFTRSQRLLDDDYFFGL